MMDKTLITSPSRVRAIIYPLLPNFD